jgi:hypothetical protein
MRPAAREARTLRRHNVLDEARRSSLARAGEGGPSAAREARPVARLPARLYFASEQPQPPGQLQVGLQPQSLPQPQRSTLASPQGQDAFSHWQLSRF